MTFIILIFIFLSNFALATFDFGAFLDSYYDYDFSSPQSRKRDYTTQPTRINEPRINMAYVDATLIDDSWRGRLALQYGTSVDANYILEKNKTLHSIQEAYLGKKLSEKLWMDAGIFLGNIGAESWISKYNWTYTRALNLDYVPYYSSGIRFEYLLNSKETIQLQILNGWQNIVENNDSKAFGFQYRKEISEKKVFTYNNFLGDDIVGGRKSRFRQYHNFILKYLYSERWQFLSAFDLCLQSQQQKNGIDGMFSPTLTVRRVITPNQSVAMRIEYYNDTHQTTVRTNSPHGFDVTGASINYDHHFNQNLAWRSEARVLNSKDKIYNEKYLDSFFVTSLNLSI